MKALLCAIARAVPATSICLSVWGCTVIAVHAPSKDDVEIKTRFGIVSVEIKPGAGAVMVESTSLGAINSFEGLAVGYHNTSIAAVAGGRCQLVLWIRTNEQLQELNSLLRDRTDVCVVAPNR